jgi:hypothetical protein
MQDLLQRKDFLNQYIMPFANVPFNGANAPPVPNNPAVAPLPIAVPVP